MASIAICSNKRIPFLAAGNGRRASGKGDSVMKTWIFAAALLLSVAGMATDGEAGLAEVVFYVH